MTGSRRADSPNARSLLIIIREHLALLFGLLGILWVVEIVDHLPLVNLDQFGIHPRSVWGLVGIALAPFLHGGFGHLAVNSLPFLILGGVVLLGGVRLFWKVTVFITLLGGFGVWLLAPKWTNHIGASGLIFGYLGFLLARGIFERSVFGIIVAIVILMSYGGLLWGLLPLQEGISWQGHLFGFLAGIAAARFIEARHRVLTAR